MAAEADAKSEARPKRESKKPDVFASFTKFTNVNKKVEIIPGSGVVLKDIESIQMAFKKTPADDVNVKVLHKALFGSDGKRLSRKKDVLAFQGFEGGGKDETEKKVGKAERVLDGCTIGGLKGLCALLSLPKGTSKEESSKDALVERIVSFLKKPQNPDEVRVKKRKSSMEGKVAVAKKAKTAKKATGKEKAAVKEVDDEDEEQREDKDEDDAMEGVVAEGSDGEDEKEDNEVEDDDEEEEKKSAKPAIKKASKAAPKVAAKSDGKKSAQVDKKKAGKADGKKAGKANSKKTGKESAKEEDDEEKDLSEEELKGLITTVLDGEDAQGMNMKELKKVLSNEHGVSAAQVKKHAEKIKQIAIDYISSKGTVEEGTSQPAAAAVDESKEKVADKDAAEDDDEGAAEDDDEGAVEDDNEVAAEDDDEGAAEATAEAASP